jgi:uncharacterized protein YwgA
MPSEKLKAILKEIDFNNSSLAGRIKFQKSVFLLQKMGMDLKYVHTIYHYGPYCSPLAHEGYDLTESGIETNEQLSTNELEILTKFKELIEGHEDDTIWFEMIATIIYLEKELGMTSKQKIFQKLCKRHEYFSKEEMFESILNDLKKYNLSNIS